MCVGALVGCSDNNDTETSPDTHDQVNTEVDGAKLNLPELDYGGADINILVRSQSLNFHDPEAQTVAVVREAVFERNVMVEELLNVKLKHTDMDGFSSGSDAFSNAIRTSAMTDGMYDIVSPTQSFGNPLIAEGIYVDLTQLEYLDMSETYWHDGYNEQAKINGKLYTAITDYDMDAISQLQVIFMNKQYLTAFGKLLEDPYTLVKDGKWTLDKMLQLSKVVTVDADSNGIWNDYDQYGWSLNHDTFSPMAASTGVNLITKDGEDYFFTLADERSISVFEKMSTAINENTIRFTMTDKTASENLFLQGRAMFNSSSLGGAVRFKALDIDYGILPTPKYSEEDEYRVGCNGMAILGITTGMSEEKLTRASAVLQALSYYSHTYVVPAYFETCLRAQAAQDVETYEMLGIIRESSYFDLALIYSRTVGAIYHCYGEAYMKGINITTYWQEHESKATSALTEFMKNFYK